MEDDGAGVEDLDRSITVSTAPVQQNISTHCTPLYMVAAFAQDLRIPRERVGAPQET